MSTSFPIFTSPLTLAHLFWEKLICKDDIVVDATIGNGKDTLVLATILLAKGGGKLFGLDIQPRALQSTRALLEAALPASLGSVTLKQQSHESFPSEIPEHSVRLIVYNLGYLPGANKTLTTMTETTLTSLNRALDLLCPGGVLSVTCYPGHGEGMKEYQAVHTRFQNLCPKRYSVSEHNFTNRALSPILVFIQKTSSN